MDQTRLDNANRLWRDGCVEEAAQEFHAMALQADYSDEKAALLANEHKCYCQVGLLDKAYETMRQIRGLTVQDKFVRMIVDVGDACMTTLMGKLEEGVCKFERLLQLNQTELQTSDLRNTYEDIQQRRAFALANLGRYLEALPVLTEAVSFKTLSVDDAQMVQFYLGICYAALQQPDLAIRAFLNVIGSGVNNEVEAKARYRLAIVYFLKRAFAQSKHHLEAALQMPDSAVDAQLRKYIYQQMSRTCHYLGESQEEQKYSRLAQSS